MRCARLALTLCLWTSLAGCAAAGSVRPPLALIPPERPPLVDEGRRITPEGIQWLKALVNAYRENCVAISVLRGEDVKQCDRGLGR